MVVTFGEIMLRLKAPGKERFFQSPSLEATFGGGEANVAIGLSFLGTPARFVTVLPEGPLGESALSILRRDGVETSRILRKKGRMGLYFLEEGGAQRPSKVIYDRDFTPISQSRPDDWNWDAIFDGARWFHITGITPALSPQARELTAFSLDEARKRGLTISLDLNFRKNLWKYGVESREVMPDLVQKAQILVANEEDLQKSLGLELHSALDASKGEIDAEAYRDLGIRVLESFPNLRYCAVTLRESINADHNRWSALLFTPGKIYQSKVYDIYPIVDRVGGGDAFSAGLIHGLTQHWDSQKSLDFAVALSCLKHSVPGDQVRCSRSEAEALMMGDESGRVQR